MTTRLCPCMQLQNCVTDNPAADLAWICELSGLQEATLGFKLTDGSPTGKWLSEWVPPQPGLSSLQRLKLLGCEPHCAAALLSATGSQLTKLDSYTLEASQPLLMDAIAKLTNLQSLELSHNNYNGITTNFRRMKALTELTLHLPFGEDDSRDADFMFLSTFAAVRTLTLNNLNGVNETLVAVTPTLPQLQALNLTRIWNWTRSLANIGQLRRELAMKHPSCCVRAQLWDGDEI